MSMRPIDLQISIPRTAEAGRVVQADQQQNMMRQQEVVNQSQTHTDNYENKVRPSEQADTKKVKEQKEREKKKQEDKKRAKPAVSTRQEDTANLDPTNKPSGGLDILA